MMASSWVDGRWKRVPGNRRGCTALAGKSHALPLSYGLSSGRSRTFDTAIRSNSALHHRRWLQGHDPGTGDCCTRRAEACRKALWPLSYRCMVHRAGFEPATSRVIGEVTEIFTTDRDGVGGERAMLLPLRGARTELRQFSRRDLNPRPPSWQAGTALYRSNRHLHHRQADAVAPAVDGYAGERAISGFQ